MKKRNAVKSLSRPKDQRKALAKSLMTGLIEKKEITTTLAKAKFLKSKMERQVSLAIKGLAGSSEKLAKTRLLKKNLCQKAVRELFLIAEVAKERKGGYLRIIKLPFRKSDAAQMAKVQWVDEIKVEEKKAKKKSSKKEGAEKK